MFLKLYVIRPQFPIKQKNKIKSSNTFIPVNTQYTTINVLIFLPLTESNDLYDDIIELLKKKYKCNSTSDFQNLPIHKRDKYVLELKKYGASLRQISRLTGISLGVIRGILK